MENHLCKFKWLNHLCKIPACFKVPSVFPPYLCHHSTVVLFRSGSWWLVWFYLIIRGSKKCQKVKDPNPSKNHSKIILQSPQGHPNTPFSNKQKAVETLKSTCFSLQSCADRSTRSKPVEWSSPASLPEHFRHHPVPWLVQIYPLKWFLETKMPLQRKVACLQPDTSSLTVCLFNWGLLGVSKA